MPTRIERAFGSWQTLTLQFDTLADQEGRTSSALDNAQAGTYDGSDLLQIAYKITLGTLTADGEIVICLVPREASEYAMDLSTDTEYGTGATPYTGAELADRLPVVHVIPTEDTVDDGNTLRGSFLLDSPPENFLLYAFNNTGAALNGTSGNHYIKAQGRVPESQ